MNILLTGSSGFLGKAIHGELLENGTSITVLNRFKSDNSFAIICDLATIIPVVTQNIEYVIHCAGKAHSVPKTEAERQDFFDVNVKGTENLLKGLDNLKNLKGFIFISSVAVYGLETGINITEKYPLNAIDPYGKSKIEAEKLIIDCCKTKNINYYILRLPLIAGKNPPGNLAAMINGIKKGYYFNIGGGMAKKSMVLANDVAKLVGKPLIQSGIYNLTDGYHPNFLEISDSIAKKLNKRKSLNLPFFAANFLAKIGDLVGNRFPINSQKLKKITSDLTFDDSKARIELGWKPSSVIENFEI